MCELRKVYLDVTKKEKKLLEFLRMRELLYQMLQDLPTKKLTAAHLCM